MATLRDIVRFGALPALAGLLAVALPAPASDRVALSGHVLPALAEPGVTRAAAKQLDSFPITLTVVLNRSDEAGFQRALAELYDPASPSYRRWMTPQEIADRFGPTRIDVDVVTDHFAAAGLEIVERSSNRQLVTVRGFRSTVERALGVTIGDFRKGDRTFRANLDEPSLPPAVARRVHAVLGMDDFARPQPVSTPQEKWTADLKSCYGTGPTVFETDPLGNAGKVACALGHVFLAIVYNLGCLTHLTLGCTMMNPLPADVLPASDGAGQKVGIVAFDNFATSDVRDFLALVGEPASRIGQLSTVLVNGGAPIGPGEHEVLLDVTTVMKHAPQADVVVYSAPNTTAGSYQAIFNRMLVDGVTIISNSWAYCEDQTTFADVSSINAILATAAAAGVSVYTASGDSGSSCLNGSPNTVAVPAGVPLITAVGGSTVNGGPGGTRTGETWWDGSGPTPTGQGGFGTSRFFLRPAYQSGFAASATRSVPDLVVSADPAAPGVVICQASNGGCPNGRLYGGTSFSAPLMAAFSARLNSALGANLGFVNPTFYALAGTHAFHPPADLGSDFAHVGIGSPNISFLHLGLRNAAPGPSSPSTSIVVPLPSEVPVDGTSVANVVVQLRDANGSAVAGKTVSLAAQPASGVTIAPGSAVTSFANGTATFTVSSGVVQQVTFTATNVSDGLVLPMTAEVSFVVPPAAAGGIQAFPTTLPNNGIATTTITITLQDAQGAPTPGKSVALAQGSGRSVITAPTPAVTDATGQIQFTATNLHDEVVTYTAIVVTDGNVPVPGNAVVTFSGSAPTSCVSGPAPNAAQGYAITPFATGFLAGTFSFSNVNWGCSGASNPAFNPAGDFLIANFRTGALYRLPAEGGAASSGDIIATPGLTIGQPVYGKDGKLYAFRSATGAGFFSGAIYELDPATGATLRTLASGLACLSPLSVDPLSGDLFFTGTCFGGGSDDPNLYRVQNPGSATPTVVSYATLPGTPNGALSFAPDGTIFVATQYLLPAPPVVRVSGTNQTQPPTVMPIAGLASFYWITVAETLPGGAAKSLVFLATDSMMKLADITVTPPAITPLIDKPMSSGVIGPDGCLYLSDLETIHKLTQANGACGFTPTNPVPAISLTPAITQPDPAQGSSIALTARLVGVPPTADVPVLFKVQGANNAFRLVRTDASGTAALAQTGTFAGTDLITAEAPFGTGLLVSNTARVTWTAGKHVSFVTLNPSAVAAVAGTPVILTASLFDNSVEPSAPIAGATLQFSVGGQSCNAVTNASGRATCPVTLALVGSYMLTVAFAGNASFNASTDARVFAVTGAGPGPCVAFDDVDADSPFCPSVEWIKNRMITLGCVSTLYCPNDVATRLQMAAFMNRLGGTLGGRVLFVEATTGALDLDAELVVCQTPDVATGTFGKRATADGVVSGAASADVALAADAVASFDGGATWSPLAAFSNRAFAPMNHWGHARAYGTADLAIAQTVRFGLRVSRGGQSGATDLAQSRCKLRVGIGNR